jgi:RNA polymerase sigma factor (sigma-70 family)
MGAHEMAQDDRILLEQWSKQGDGEAFRTLVTRYSGVVYAACRRILGNQPGAEDIAQECFEALAAAGGKPGANVGAWLHRVATYHAISHVRSEVRRKKRESQYAASQTTENVIEWKDIYQYVDEAVNKLPDKLRLPVIAHYLQGQSKESIALSLGISRQLASYRMDQGIKHIRHALQRNKIYLSVGALAALVEAHAVEAAPAEFLAKLGKIALVGPGATAPVAALAAVKAASGVSVGGTILKVSGGMAAAAVIVALGLFLGWKEIWRPYPTQNITAKSTFTVEENVPVEQRLETSPTKEGEDPASTNTAAEVHAVQTLEPGTVVYGVVLDESLRPVPKATVTLDNQEQVETALYAKKTGFAGPTTAVASLELQQSTDARGEFVFKRVPPRDNREGLILTARSGDLYATKPFGAFGDMRQRRHELILAPAGLVKGRVVDEKNKGVPNIYIQLCSQFTRSQMLRGFALVTQEDGSFVSRPLPYGSYELTLTETGFKDVEPIWLNADGQEHIIRLEREGPTASISGWVVNEKDGKRMPGLFVMAYYSSDTKAYRFNDTTNENGEFHITVLTPNEYHLRLGQQNEPYCCPKRR